MISRFLLKTRPINLVSLELGRFTHSHVVPGLVCYNSASKLKSELSTKEPGILTWYTCGPTVYESSHIGHAWCYVHLDIIRRILEKHFSMIIMQVMNITDIDDKIIRKAAEKNVTIKEIATKYESEFFSDMAKLNVQRPSVVMRVSDYVPAITSFIETLMAKEMAYIAPDGSVNFSLKKYQKKNKYGKLKPASTERTNNGEGSTDFALWKASKSADEPGWCPTWGGVRGRPGWHIECSAMASHAFGSVVDLHSGGIDLRFPHHENEEAQCCAYFDSSQWVGHWLHIGHVKLPDGIKMSKSLNNYVLINDFLSSYSADNFRMLCLISNYRKDFQFSEESLLLAKTVLDSVSNFVDQCSQVIKEPSACPDLDYSSLITALQQTRTSVFKSLGDDFNTAVATSAVRKLVSLTNKEMQKPIRKYAIGDESALKAITLILHFVSNYFTSLGIASLSEVTEVAANTRNGNLQDEAIAFRKEIRRIATEINTSNPNASLRKTKQDLFAACDKLRDALKATGIPIKDGKSS